MVTSSSLRLVIIAATASATSAEDCCEGMTADCVACKLKQSKAEFCAENPSFSGCDKPKCACPPDVEDPSVPPCNDPPDCVPSTEVFVQESECKWFMEKTTIRVKNAMIVHGDAGSQCDFATYGRDHHAACGTCALQHRPCDGVFAACPGCCFTGGPPPLNDLMCDRVPQHHKCSDFQEWFFAQNMTLNCTDVVPKDNVKDDGTIVPNELDVIIEEPLAKGKLSTKCLWETTTEDCPKVPAKVRLDCTDCAIKANPKLLGKCCDLGLELATGPQMQRLEAKGLAPQLWIDGCHESKLKFNQYPFEVPFPNFTKYAEYTEAAADQRLRDSVESNYCSKGIEEDPSICIGHNWDVVKQSFPQCVDDRRLALRGSAADEAKLEHICEVPAAVPASAAAEISSVISVVESNSGYTPVELALNASGYALALGESSTEAASTTVEQPGTTMESETPNSNDSSNAAGVSAILALLVAPTVMCVMQAC